jgi:phospholipid transport system substrate-binding protein
MTMILRRSLLAAAPALLLAGVARADAPAAAAPVATLQAGLVAIMKAGKATPFQKRFDMLAPIVDKVFDLDTILRNIVGPRWDSFTDAQKTALQQAFRAFTVASYVSNFDGEGPRFEILPETRSVGSDVVVETRIVPQSGDPSRIDYQMRETAGAWRVVDVLLDGSISRVAVQRSDFRHILGSGGPDALVKTLHDKVQALSGGTLQG